MAWLAPDSAALSGLLTAAEMEGLRRSLPAGAGDPVTAALASAVNQVRGYAGAAGPLGAAGTVPPELWQTTLVLARWQLVSRLPSSAMATDARKAEYEEALRLLRDAAAGRYAFEPAAGGDPTATAAGPRLSATNPRRRFTRDLQEGL